MKNNDKTNLMRILDKKNIDYVCHTYDPDPTMTGEEIAGVLGEDVNKVFKHWSPGESPGSIMFLWYRCGESWS